MNYTHFAGQEFPQGKPMPTKTPREKMEKYLADNGIVLHSREERIILSFIDTLLEEARKEERKNIKEKAEKLKRDITICQCGPGDGCDKCPRQKDVSYNFALEHLIQSL